MTADTVDNGLARWLSAVAPGCGHIEAIVKGDSDDVDVGDDAMTVAAPRPPRPQPVVVILSIGWEWLGGGSATQRALAGVLSDCRRSVVVVVCPVPVQRTYDAKE